jgi:predicted MFS family arabinose efflux permease
MASRVDGFALYPLAFVALVLSKTQSVTKSSLVPSVIKDKSELVLANSRLSLISLLGGLAAGPLAAGVLKLGHAPWVLRCGSVIFVLGLLASLGLPRAERAAPAETADQKEVLHSRSIVTAGTAMALMRGAVGFFTFFAAFLLKSRHEPAWLFGLILVMSGLGTAIGSLIAPVLRKRTREEWILAGALLGPSIPLVIAARQYGRTALLVAALAIATASSAGRLAFDSLLQRDGADAARGRAFARFETWFALAWVLGGVIAVGYWGGGRSGIFLVALVMLFGGLSYIGAVRRPAGVSPTPKVRRNPVAPAEPPE